MAFTEGILTTWTTRLWTRTSPQPVYNLLRMSQFQLWAQPWWVNLLILIPFAAVFSFQRAGQLLGVRQWLDPGMNDVAEASDLLKPYDGRRMGCYPISTRINHVALDDKECSAQRKS